jgi:Transcriptional regulators
MATIKDIAKLAGVSHATVSYVLNHKGKVSSQKIKLVEDAAMSLGYQLDKAASSLRAGSSKIIVLVLPESGCTFFNEVFKGTLNPDINTDYTIQLFTSNGLPEHEKQIILEVIAMKAKGVIVLSCLPDPFSEWKAVTYRDIDLKILNHVNPADNSYIGLSISSIVECTKQKISSYHAKTIGIFLNTTTYRYEKEFLEKLKIAMRQEKAALKVVEISNLDMTKQALAFFENGTAPDLIIATSEESALAFVDAYHYFFRTEPIIPVIALTKCRILFNKDIIPLQMNFRELGERALSAIVKNEKCSFELKPLGFRNQVSSVPPVVLKERRISLLNQDVDNPTSAAIKTLAPLFFKDTGIKIQSFPYTLDNLRLFLDEQEKFNSFDIIRTDMIYIDSFAEKLLSPIDDVLDNRNEFIANLLPGLEREYCLSSSGVAYTLPLDPSMMMLYYRKDLFSDTTLQRMFYETYKAELKVPSDFLSFHRIVSFFNTLHKKDPSYPYGTSTNNGISCVLQYFVSATGKRTIESFDSHYGDLLEKIKDINQTGRSRSSKSWRDTVADLTNGNCAMVIAFSNYAEFISSNPLSSAYSKIGYAEVPGAIPLLGGGVLGVSKATKAKDEVKEFFNWLYSDEIATKIALLSGNSSVKSTYENPVITETYPWLPLLGNSFHNGVRRRLFTGIEKPFIQKELENSLEFYSYSAINGIGDVDRALSLINGLYKEYRDK